MCLVQSVSVMAGMPLQNALWIIISPKTASDAWRYT